MRAMDDPTDEPDRRPALTLIRGGLDVPGPTRARINLDKIATVVCPEFNDCGQGGVAMGWDHPRAFISIALTPEGAWNLAEKLQSAAVTAGFEP